MLETIDTSKKVDKEAYKEWLPRLKTDLRELQQKVREAGIPVLVIFEGLDTSGKGDSIRHLSEVLDPRGFRVHVAYETTEDERKRPWLWRYWVNTPARGRISFCERFWYYRLLNERIDGLVEKEEWSHAYQDINQTEEMLHEDGALIVKFWLHISRKEQKKRLKAAENDPFLRYTVTKREWGRHKKYEEFIAAAEEMLERTSTHISPWHIVEANDRRYRRMRVLQHLCEEIANALNRQERRKKVGEVKNGYVSVPVLEEMPTLLDKVDLTKKLDEEEYQKRKVEGQVRLHGLQIEAVKRGVSSMVVYQGWDAAGKGGNIRRLTATLDPRFYSVIPISKPTDEELSHHYLWRFWNHVPPVGHMTIFDRSHYGRVMVERIEGFCTEADWRRAYQEINEFEMQLYRAGIAIVKFFIHITPEEQLRRFESRQNDPNKAWKMTDEDWRNREKWDQYRESIDEMIQRTSTTYAPWTIIEGNDKRFARVKGIEVVCKTLEEALERKAAQKGKSSSGKSKN